MYSSHLDTQGELHFLDICNLVNEVEYEHFVFHIDSMYLSYVYDGSKFDVYNQEHVDMQFHSEQDEESNSCFYMHYENGFVSPNLLMRRSNVCGKTKESQSFSLMSAVMITLIYIFIVSKMKKVIQVFICTMKMVLFHLIH